MTDIKNNNNVHICRWKVHLNVNSEYWQLTYKTMKIDVIIAEAVSEISGMQLRRTKVAHA